MEQPFTQAQTAHEEASAAFAATDKSTRTEYENFGDTSNRPQTGTSQT